MSGLESVMTSFILCEKPVELLGHSFLSRSCLDSLEPVPTLYKTCLDRGLTLMYD